MKFNKLGLVICGIAAIGFSERSYATDATGNATAEIRVPITLSESTSMDFGAIVADPAGDVVTLTAAGSISSTGASDFYGTPSPSTFDATGKASTAVTISFSTGDTLTGPGTAMGLGTFTHNAGGSPAFNGSGNLSFDVGASLTVGTSQAAGVYTGTYTATVDYP